MAKTQKADPAVNQVAEVVIASLKDAGQQQAKNNSMLETITRYVMGKAPTLGDATVDRKVNAQIPDKDTQAELKAGYMLHYGSNIKKPRYFIVTANDKQYVEQVSFEEMMKHEKLEKRQLTVDGVMAMTQAELNRLKDEEPSWLSLVQELKTSFNQYASNRFGDLIKKAIELRTPADEKRQRGKTKTFVEWEELHIEAILTKAKTVRNKSVVDDTLDYDLVLRKVKAYREAE